MMIVCPSCHRNDRWRWPRNGAPEDAWRILWCCECNMAIFIDFAMRPYQAVPALRAEDV